MNKSNFLISLALSASCSLLWGAEKKPNILFILADDMGYADLSIQGCSQYKTPHIDSIFNGGVRFKQGYVSNSVCAPSRAGLITGRMGSQFGFEANLPKKSHEPGSTIGLDPAQKTIADILKPAGYKSYCLGKWHLGYNVELFHPNKRGFDEFVGLLGGSRSYFALDKLDPHQTLQHNGEYIEEAKEEDFYITDYLTDRAIGFIEEQQSNNPDQPFFMYLSYTAPHGPMHAKASDLARVQHIPKSKRQTYAAMVLNLDDNIGRVLACLNSLDIMENTMVVFLSDNGGPIKHNGSDNGTLTGAKGSLWEGGIRVPYAIQWKGKIRTEQVQDTPVSSLDLLPTFAAISGADKRVKIKSDGVNLMPLLTQQVESLPTRKMHWRRASKKNIVTRFGKYKYLKRREINKEYLFNIEDDIEEKNNLASSLPEVLERMRKLHDQWEASMPEPAFSSGGKAKK